MNSDWKVEFTETALKQLKKIDKPASARLIKWLEDRLLSGANPRLWGKQLKGEKFGDTWRYRIGHYRVLCFIRNDTVTILILEIGHRKNI